MHLADEERDAVCSAARSLDPYGISRIKMQSFRSQIHKMARTAGNTGKGMTEKQHKSQRPTKGLSFCTASRKHQWRGKVQSSDNLSRAPGFRCQTCVV